MSGQPPEMVMSDVLVSFLMPTRGRVARQPHIINEAVYWFTRQEYPHVELVILNDAPDQVVQCDIPNVMVYNLPPFASLGQKYNALVALARGLICCPYEDDDISLPHRAGQAIEMVSRTDYWSPKMYFFYQKAKDLLTADGAGVGHTSAAFRRESLAGRFPDTSTGHDSIVDHWAYNNLACNPTKLTNRGDWHKLSYVYRWGVSDFHHSAFFPKTEEAFRDTPTGPPGTYHVVPEMGEVDWVKRCGNFLKG